MTGALFIALCPLPSSHTEFLFVPPFSFLHCLFFSVVLYSHYFNIKKKRLPYTHPARIQTTVELKNTSLRSTSKHHKCSESTSLPVTKSLCRYNTISFYIWCSIRKVKTLLSMENLTIVVYTCDLVIVIYE